MGDVVDPLARRGQVPVDEGDRAQRPADGPVDRVSRREVVVAHDGAAVGQGRARRQVVELPHQPGDPGQALVRVHGGGLPGRRLPGDVPVEVAEDLPALVVHAAPGRRARPAAGLQQRQQLRDERGARRGGPAYRVADPHHVAHGAAGQGLLGHPVRAARPVRRPRPAPASAFPGRRVPRPVRGVRRRAWRPSRSPWRCRRSGCAAWSRSR